MTPDEGITVSPVDWEEIGWIDVDAAGVAFCTEGTRLSEPQINSTHTVEDGIVYQVTKEDCPLPVEVRRDDVGDIVAARMCFTNDVDVIEGSWVHIGKLDLADGLCTACDPYCDGPQYRLSLGVHPGRYLAEVFRHSDTGGVDVLGLRITLTESIEGKELPDATLA